MKKSTLFTLVLITLILLVIPQSVTARGAGDSTGEYAIELQGKFEELAASVEEGSLNREEAIEQLRDFQESNDRYNKEEFQFMESCINGVDSGEWTSLKAQEKVANMVQTRERTQLKTEEPKETNDQDQTGDGDQNKGENDNNSSNGKSGGK